MKTRSYLSSLIVSALMAILLACGPAEHKETPNSEINSATKSGVDESNKAKGVGEGNQDKTGDYPANQANLHPDSTGKDTLRKRN